MKRRRFNVSFHVLVCISLIIFFTVLYSLFSFQLRDTNAQPYNQNDLLFEMDVARNIRYMTTTDTNFYRTSVHPLFVILVNPIGSLLTRIGFSPSTSSILINSFFAAICIGVSYILFELISKNRWGSLILSIIFGFSSSQLILSIVPDTSALATLSLLITYIVFLKSIENEHLPKYYWLIAGIFTLGITITNFIQTLICFQVSQLGRKSPKKIITSTILFFGVVVSISIVLSLIQKMLYPSSALFFIPSVYREELNYTSTIILSQPLVVIRQIFTHFFLANIVSPIPEIISIHPLYPAITFYNSKYGNIFGVLALVFWMGLVLLGIFKYKTRTNKLLSFGFSMCLLFNIFLHSVYGVGEKGKIELFLYTGNFSILVILLLFGWTLFYKRKWIIGIQIAFSLLLICNSLSFVQGVKEIFNNPEYITARDAEMRKLVEDAYEYRTELRNFRNIFVHEKSLPGSNFFLFGMGNRQKYLYRNGTLVDITSSKIVKQWEVNSEIIVPSEYSVGIINQEGKNIYIVEDGSSIYIRDGMEIEEISTGCEINLPEFRDFQYPKIMKVFHHEVLINIIDGKPTPNFVAYPEPWYRDAAMMAMVLERTQNIQLIEDWIMNLDEIYDMQNGEKESDNLGEVLYLISLVSEKNHPLVPGILHEISLLNSSGFIQGKTDNGYHPVYQTKWAKFGLAALGIEDQLIIPGVKDNYSVLTWWYSDKDDMAMKVHTQFRQYPYLMWAQSHYFNQKEGIISNSDYPLTWEANASKANYFLYRQISPLLAEKHIAAPHAWHAAEAFLYLMDID
jgi:hypothetical protein